MNARTILFVLFLFCSTWAYAQDNLFEKYSNMDNVTSVYISKSMFQLMPDGVQAGGVDFSDLKGKIDHLQILTSENRAVSKQMQADFEGMVKGYELLMKVKSDDTRASFFVKQKGERINDMVMLTDEENEFVVIRLAGDFTVQDIQRIANAVN